MVSLPHGGKLVQVQTETKESIQNEFRKFPIVGISNEEALTVFNISCGIFSPFKGFMLREDFDSVLSTMRTTDDLPWTIPLSLFVSQNIGDSLRKSSGSIEILLAVERMPVATMQIEDVFPLNKKQYCEKVFGTLDPSHPGVCRIISKYGYVIGGPITRFFGIQNPYENYTLTPIETRVLFQEKGWKSIVAFQTRNAPHIGHEYVQKTALSFADGIFINPVIGRKKKGDFSDQVILEAYKTLIAHYYPKNSVVLSILLYEMQYAGPREAVMHAIMRKNFGCTHIAIGRDHAGVGNFYKPYAAQEIFKEFPDLGITPIFFKEFFYCKKCEGISNEKICPHDANQRLTFSGTALRNMFLKGKAPPKEFMRPEVAKVILSAKIPFVE